MTKESKTAIGVFLILIVGVLGFMPSALPIRLIKQIMLEWAVIALVALFFIKPFWMKIFLLYSLSLTIWNHTQDPEIAKASYFTTMTIFLAFITYQIFYEKLIISRKSIYIILNIFCIVTIIQLAVMYLQMFNIWLFGMRPRLELTSSSYIVGLLDNSNTSGIFLALMIPAFCRKNWYYGIPFIAVALFKTKCFSAITALMIGLYFCYCMCYEKYKIKLFIIMVLLPIAYYLNFENISNFSHFNKRIPLWKSVFNNIIPRFWLHGWGPGQFKVLIDKITKMLGEPVGKKAYVHNEYLQLWLEYGAIGVSIVLGYITSLIVKLYKRRTRLSILLFTAILIGLLNAFVNFYMHLTVGIVMIIYFALFEKEIEYAKD